MNTPLLYDVPEAQKMLGDLGRTSLYELIKTGALTTVKIGRRTFISRETLESYVASNDK